MIQRIILHIDFDYFYAQCEEIRSPELKTKPVVVCVYSDRGGDSGAVATANYMAREFGVKSGMPIQFSKKKLQERHDSVFLPTDFDYYSNVSEKAMKIIEKFADVFEYVGKDEAFLDVSKKTEGSFDKASHLAQQIKNIIREKVKLTCSIGISPNKLVSKIASDFKKPDGLTVVQKEKVEFFLDSLKIRVIPGIGKKTETKFSEMRLGKIADLKKLDIFSLNQLFGRKSGSYIYNAARGIDEEPVEPRAPNIQYSKIVTLKKDSRDFSFLADNIGGLCKEVHQIIRNKSLMFKSVGIQIVQTDLSIKTKSRMLRNPTSTLEELMKTSKLLLREALEDQILDIRRLGVKVSELSQLKGQSNIDSYL